jgi:hypothetical protein
MNKIDSLRERVEHIVDGAGMHIDPSIKELVIGLMANGIETKASCEGHPRWGKKFPWVDVSKEDLSKVFHLVARQNRPKLLDGRDNINTWVIRPGATVRLTPENKDMPLKTMQDNAREFGLFLQSIAEE